MIDQSQRRIYDQLADKNPTCSISADNIGRQENRPIFSDTRPTFVRRLDRPTEIGRLYRSSVPALTRIIYTMR